MSLPPALLEASTELLEKLRDQAQSRHPEQLWQEVLHWLVVKTHALGGRLSFATPVLPALQSGRLHEATLTWLAARMGQAPMTAPETHALSDRQVLLLLLRGHGIQPSAWLALEFAADCELIPEHAQLLGGALQALADFVATSLELDDTRQRLNRFRHLYEVGQAIASTLDLDQVLRQSTTRVAEVLHAEASTLLLIDEARQELVFKIPAGPAERMLLEKRMPIDKGVAGWAATHGQPVIIGDVQADARFYDDIDRMTGYRTHSIMAVPLQVKGRMIGVLEVVNKIGGGAFTADDLQWLSILAPLIAVATDNARLYADLREERDRIVVAEEKVRHELARNLHDGPAQIMAAIILNIDMARRQLAAKPEKMATELNYLESLAQEANQEVRDLLFNLRPLNLEAHGLVAALNQLRERIQVHAGYEIHLEVDRFPTEGLDVSVTGTLFVIVQEALNNIQKHAQAQNVWLRLGTTEDRLWIEVLDDGVGFDVGEVDAGYARLNSFGLLNMRERARLIDGQTRIMSPRPGFANGTVVHVEVPLSRASSSGVPAPDPVAGQPSSR